MSFTAEARRKKFWFGTEARAEFFATPNRGADVSPTGWESGGSLLNGGGYQLNSFGSHKNFLFEWPSSSAREVAQLMKSYADGTYGRGLIYFIDPLTWTTNMLPAQLADPSMALGYEGTSLVYGIDPVSVPTSGWEENDLPVNSAYYDLAGVTAGWRGKEQAVFIPVPTGYTLSLGSFHSQSGNGRVYYREQAKNGALGTITELTPLANNSSQVVNTFVSGPDLAGVWMYVGKSGAGAGSVTLTAMIGRLIETVKTQSTMVAQNLFTNPNLVGDGTWAEVRRNYNVLARRPEVWSKAAGVTLTPVSDVRFESAPVEKTGTGWITFGTTPAVAGDVWTVSLRHTLPAGETFNPLTSYVGFGGGTIPAGTTVSRGGVDNLDGTYTSWNTRACTGPGAVNADLGSAPVSGVYVLGDPMYEKSPTLNPYFDGSSPDFSVDPDMRQRWLGAENASESVMEIERVRGLIAQSCIVGVSSWEGKPAARLIPTGAINNSVAAIIVPASARASGTLVGASHTPVPLTGTLNSNPRNLTVYSPTSRSSVPGLPAGSFPQRLHWTSLTSNYVAELRHGGSLGSGDVWWTDIGLFAGTYDGPAFAGDTGSVVINGRSYRTQWDGATDNSTSSAWTMTPEFDALKEGPWIGGQGHSGCRFIGKPTYVNNTGVDGGQVSFAASFREVGLWVNG